MSKQQKPAHYRRGSITQRPETHGPAIKGGKAYGLSKEIVQEISQHLHDTLIDRHADPSLGRGAMFELTPEPYRPNSLQPNGGWDEGNDDVHAGPSRQGKRSKDEQRVLPEGTITLRGKRAKA